MFRRVIFFLLFLFPFLAHSSVGRIVSVEEGYWSDRDDLYGQRWYQRHYDVHRPDFQSVRDTVSAALYMKNSLEYRLLTQQIYRGALVVLRKAQRDARATALLEQKFQADAPSLPLAIMMNVDQAVLDVVPPLSVRLKNGHFIHPYVLPRSVSLLNNLPLIPGALAFIHAVQSAGVHVIFVSDRICRAESDYLGRCPQQQAVIRNLRRFGISANRKNVLLAGQEPDWGINKSSRRLFVARRYRVLLQVSSSIHDFISFPRDLIHVRDVRYLSDVVDEGIQSRWVLLPNPLYGDWLHYEKLRWCSSLPIRSFSCLAGGLGVDMPRYSLSSRDLSLFDEAY